MKFMLEVGKSFLRGFISFVAGAIIAGILTSVVYKIGWNNKEAILIWGYAALFSVVTYYVTIMTQYKKSELKRLEDTIECKANKDEIKNLHHRLDDVKQSVNEVKNSIVETNSKIDDLTKLIIKKL